MIPWEEPPNIGGLFVKYNNMKGLPVNGSMFITCRNIVSIRGRLSLIVDSDSRFFCLVQ